MKVRKIFISVSIGLIFMATGAALILMRFGQPPVRSILIAAAFFVLCFIPVAGTCRSLRQKEGDGGSEFRKGKLAVIRPFVLFVLSPLLCGLIGFLTYPSAFTGPLILIVMVGASLFYFMYGNVSDKKVVTKKLTVSRLIKLWISLLVGLAMISIGILLFFRRSLYAGLTLMVAGCFLQLLLVKRLLNSKHL